MYVTSEKFIYLSARIDIKHSLGTSTNYTDPF